MIVCSCNRIREGDIREAARAGALCPESAYARLGFEPECGGCLDHAAEVITDERRRMIRIVPKAAA
ncbi:MAG TPA: (2Fe-2S)-binding protein [Sphingomicrobium sp.]|jgi:bacterioferritin-associated ferredoxin|nr:(2Fe-2S)-binding protein [Sphingomicrobium sp.]HXH52399.1 (2Fe-2S)-binding protein [Sphingomicrobium sp.]